MGNTIKRFLTNKNTVTLLAIVACVVVLYLFYNWRVKQAVTTTEVCYATQTIPARTEITEDMIMTEQDRKYYLSLIDELRKLPTETEWVEFKANNFAPNEIGEYL